MKIAVQQLGQAAETLAAIYLQKQDFTILSRNYRHRRAEIDIIAQKHQLLVFIEVKARSSNQFGEPETFVTRKQQALVRTAAEHYIITHDWSHAIRFDIIAILKTNNHMQLTYFEDAF